MSSKIEKASSMVWTAVGLASLIATPIVLIYKILDRTRLSAVDAEYWVAEVFIAGVYAVTFTVMCYVVAREIAKEKQRRMGVVWPLLAIVDFAAAAMLLLLGTAVVTIGALGHSVAIDPPTSGVTVADVFRQLMWDVVKTVPVLDVPEGLAWERPIEDPAAPLGVASLIVRVWTAVIVLESIKLVFDNTGFGLRKPEPGVRADDGSRAVGTTAGH